MLILVGGPGGAGKTSLAGVLADRMGFVHVSRDRVKSAIAATDASIADGRPTFDVDKARMGGEYGQRAFATTYAAVTVLLDDGASVIVDQAWRSGRSEAELRPLLDRSRPVLLMATVEPRLAADRARSRGRRNGLAPLDHALASADEERESFLAFDPGVPRLMVDTTDGYDPSLPHIESWIWRNVSTPRR